MEFLRRTAPEVRPYGYIAVEPNLCGICQGVIELRSAPKRSTTIHFQARDAAKFKFVIREEWVFAHDREMKHLIVRGKMHTDGKSRLSDKFDLFVNRCEPYFQTSFDLEVFILLSGLTRIQLIGHIWPQIKREYGKPFYHYFFSEIDHAQSEHDIGMTMDDAITVVDRLR
jgi:hypothetical protein